MISKCIKCGGMSFEIQEQSPGQSRYKMYFVQCVSCGAPIGVTDFYNTSDRIGVLEDKINKLSREMSNIEFQIRDLVHRLKNRTL